MEKSIFTSGEVAKICSTSLQTINRWLNSGELPGYRPTPKADWRITRKNLVKFMKENNIPLEFINGDKIKILVIDDEPSIPRTIQKVFKNEEKFEIETASSGFTAGAKLESIKPDVVILDIFLGDMDGREFFKYIHNHPDLNNVKVIGISGKLRKEEVEQLYKTGFDAFLKKPFIMSELKETILKIMEE